jgi:ammonium transporter, Amt family
LGLRSKEADEYDGLDLAEHDIGAYPDFQQTMIKSYHLREA